MNEKPVRPFVMKLDSGEYIRSWNGFYPFYVGCYYGYKLCLGGEEKFSHCYGSFHGIGDDEWWIKEELDKLTEEEQEELLFILKRNKEFHEYKDKIVPGLAELLNVEKYQIHRVPNKDIKNFIDMIHANSN